MTVPDQGEGDEAVAAEGGVSEQAATKQAPKKRPQKKTVEQNLSNINLSESEMKCEVKALGSHRDTGLFKPAVFISHRGHAPFTVFILLFHVYGVPGGPDVPAHGCVFR